MSVIHNGKLYKDRDPEPPKSSPEFKRWSHDEQRRAHLADLTPRHKHGKPNPEFIRIYEEESKLSFTPEQIREFGNQY